MSKATVLIVEDEAIVAADLKNKLEQFGYEVAGVTARGEEAVALARLRLPQIVLMDIRLRGKMDGIEAAEAIRRECDLPVIYLTAHSDAATLERAKQTEPYGYILKPFEERELLTHIEMALYKHQAEKRLRASEERLRIAKNAAHLGIHDYDIASGTIHWDERMRELWGIGPDVPVTYDLFMSALHPDDRAATQAAVDRALDPGGRGEYAAEYRVVSRTDGVERWVAATGHVFFEEGRPVRLVGTAQDITERKRAEAELLAAKNAAEAGNRAKERFLVNMSHELRTPLTVIMGMLELALAEDIPPSPRRCLEAARASSETLLSLIADLLDFAHLEKGVLSLEDLPFDLHRCIRETVHPFLAAGAAKGIALHLTIAPTVPRAVLGDCGRLSQVLENLVGNAVRFTEKGGIDISVSTEGASGERREVRFAVRDTGIGIPDEALQRLFRKFTQVDDSLTRRFGGSGLGLALSRGLVERMGGKIRVESAVGEGSLFSFVIPFRVDDGAEVMKER